MKRLLRFTLILTGILFYSVSALALGGGDSGGAGERHLRCLHRRGAHRTGRLFYRGGRKRGGYPHR